MSYRTYNLTFLVYGEKDITFKSSYACIEERSNGLYCSLEGEFLKDGQSFDPPLRYKIGDVGVTTRDLNQIITERYHGLKEEKE